VSPDGNGSSSEVIAGINVTPMVDITLVLLIIFIVTAKIIVTPAVPLDLPQATKTEEVQLIFSVLVPQSGPTLVNGERIASDAELAARAHTAVTGDPELRAVVQADGAVPHRRVIAVLDALRTAGVSHIAFGATPAVPSTR
jgi:biopolymer transport protein TolR